MLSILLENFGPSFGQTLKPWRVVCTMTARRSPSDGTLWGGCLLFNKADFERLVLLGRPSYNAAAQICGECFADRDAYPFSDLSRHATWRPTAACMTNEVYVARHRQSGHPMADWPILSKYFHRLDTMHAIDHNGVCGVLIGSVWRKLVKSEPRLGTNQQARLNTLNGKMQEYFDNHVVSCRLPKLLLSNLVDMGGWSNLCGPLVKAANVRHSTPFAEVLAREFFRRWQRVSQIDRESYLVPQWSY